MNCKRFPQVFILLCCLELVIAGQICAGYKMKWSSPDISRISRSDHHNPLTKNGLFLKSGFFFLLNTPFPRQLYYLKSNLQDMDA
jgi:hypothetical protein